MEWTEELIARLRSLWDEGHSTAEIGRILGISKNAVVGKAHRLNLPARPSPIRREPSSEPRRPRRHARGPTLPPLSAAVSDNSVRSASGSAVLPMAANPFAGVPADLGGATASPVASHTISPGVGAPARPYARRISCCWPLGEPGTPGFHFCGAEAVPGKPYCVSHAQLAYVRVRDRRDDAA
jgi:GcrA cell cycle regulator